MRVRHRFGVVAVALGSVALVLGLTVSPAHAAPPEKVGWWFQPFAGPLALPVPVPVVPDGGLFVQQGATGPIAYGAIRYHAADGASSALTLTAAPGSTALAATLQACRTSTTWDAPSSGPGDFDKRPSFGNPCVPGLVASDGTAVAFNLNASFVSGGALDIAIVPTAAATPFAVAFEAPADDALQNAGGKPSVSPPLPTTSTVPGGVAPSGGAPAGTASPSFSPAAPAAPVAPVTAAPVSANLSPVAGSVLNAVGLGDVDRGARAAALGGASLIVVGWWLLSTRTVPMPRLLGGMGSAAVDDASPEKTAHVGGVGRFARARATAALKLR